MRISETQLQKTKGLYLAPHKLHQMNMLMECFEKKDGKFSKAKLGCRQFKPLRVKKNSGPGTCRNGENAHCAGLWAWI